MAEKPAHHVERTAVIYVRVSTEQQANEGVGLEAQEAKCRQAADARGLLVTHVFADKGISGKEDVRGRPGVSEALRVVRETPDAVLLVYSVSRLARNQRLVWELIDPSGKSAIPLVSATEPFDTSVPMGRAMLGIIAVWSQLESDMISERTKDALALKRAQGVTLGGPNMLRFGGEDQIRLIQDLYATKAYSYATLAKKLNDDGVPTVTARGRWWANTVRTALAVKLPPSTPPMEP